MQPLNLYEYEARAREVMEHSAFDYYAGGANDEISLERNHRAYDEVSLRYRVLRDASRRDLSTAVLGTELEWPVLIAPTAFQRLAHPDGEVAMARAAGNLGTTMVVSTMATSSLEQVATEAHRPLWFQLYIFEDRGLTAELVTRAAAAGYRALALTVDAPLCGLRERDVRNAFHLPDHLQVENLRSAGHGGLPATEGDSGLAAYITSQFDPALTWDDVEWLASLSHMPVLVKGVVHPDDARLAREHGAAGVVVSNHGGRQLDTSPATIEALPEVAEAAGDLAVLVDGGIRRGTDVVKALALGAQAVLVGRPALWGLAVGGQEGVEHALGLLRQELDLAMGLCGCQTLDEIGLDLIGRRGIQDST